jgi:hypothetical protein
MHCAWLTIVVAFGAAEPVAAIRIAVPDMQLTGDIDPSVGQTMTEVVVSESAALGGAAVIGASDIRALIGFEQQRQLLGCSDASCMAELTGALGVDLLLVSDLGKVGDSWVLNLKLVDARDAHVRARVNRTVQGDVDVVLDNLRTAMRELLVTVATPPEESALGTVAIWSLIGVGGAALTSALVLEVLAKNEYEEARSHRSVGGLLVVDYELHSPESRDHFDSATQLGRAALGLAIGGTVLAAGGVTWLLVRHTRGQQLEVRPAVGEGAAAVYLTGSF